MRSLRFDVADVQEWVESSDRSPFDLPKSIEEQRVALGVALSNAHFVNEHASSVVLDAAQRTVDQTTRIGVSTNAIRDRVARNPDVEPVRQRPQCGAECV